MATDTLRLTDPICHLLLVLILANVVFTELKASHICVSLVTCDINVSKEIRALLLVANRAYYGF